MLSTIASERIWEHIDSIGIHALDPEIELKTPKKAVEVDTSVYDKCVGEYGLAPNFIITISKEGDKFFAQVTGQDTFEIFPLSESRFFYRVVDTEIEFSRDDDGKVNGFVPLWMGDPGRRDGWNELTSLSMLSQWKKINLHKPISPMEKRPSWDQYFMRMALLVAERSTCLRRSVGAVIVKDKRILTTGYNGAPRGLKHCSEVGCLREKMSIPSGQRHELCRGVHAEQNAIIQAAIFGLSIENSTIYTTNCPCVLCTKMIINSGINRIVYVEDYFDDLSKDLLEESGIDLQRLDL